MGVFTSAHIHMSVGTSKCAGMSICRVYPQCLHASLPACACVCSRSLFAHVEWLCFNCGPFQTLVERPEGIQQHLERTDAWS